MSNPKTISIQLSLEDSDRLETEARQRNLSSDTTVQTCAASRHPGFSKEHQIAWVDRETPKSMGKP